MLTRRIIACLDVKDGRTVKGVRFEELRDAGDPVELGALYSTQGIDELVYLDITATVEKRTVFVELVRRVAGRLSIPFTVGGGVRVLDDALALLDAGADKVAINSAAVRTPAIIEQLSSRFGSQCVVVAIDSRLIGGRNIVHLDGGRTATELETEAWAEEAVERGAGEILLTSMDHDGTKNGFAIELTRKISRAMSVPVIASGGAGTKEHFAEVFSAGEADAALAASVFHFGEIPIRDLKGYLRAHKIAVRI